MEHGLTFWLALQQNTSDTAGTTLIDVRSGTVASILLQDDESAAVDMVTVDATRYFDGAVPIQHYEPNGSDGGPMQNERLLVSTTGPCTVSGGWSANLYVGEADGYDDVRSEHCDISEISVGDGLSLSEDCGGGRLRFCAY